MSPYAKQVDQNASVLHSLQLTVGSLYGLIPTKMLKVQCDQIGRFFKVFGSKFVYKSSPIFFTFGQF